MAIIRKYDRLLGITGVSAVALLLWFIAGCSTPGAPLGPPPTPPLSDAPVVRGQYPPANNPGYPTTGSPGAAVPGAANVPAVPPPYGAATLPATTPSAAVPQGGQPGGVPLSPVPPLPPPTEPLLPGPRTAPLDIYAEETTTGRFNFGVGVNSDLGVTGQIIIDERNFDLFRLPRSWEDLINGRAFRGAGQGFRIEAIPGNQVQRYVVSFTEPYLFSTPVSMSTSGFLFDRAYQDWMEQRFGGRLSFGYRLTPDLSANASIRAEQVKVYRPRFLGIPPLDDVLGDNDLYSGRVSLIHDTRDIPFAPTEGHLIELSYEQVFGDYDYPRFEAEYRRYFLLKERPDGSGRHTLGAILSGGISGSQTPIFENYFAGGFSTMRGFSFRGASPVLGGVIVGGRTRILGSLEYLFPLTADDMIKGVVFTDFGTVERDLTIRSDNFRVAPGFGVRVSVPALGPAPLAFDFAFPIHHAPTDDLRVFSFFVGFGR